MGLVFLRTADREPTVAFYRERVGCRVWHEQPDCTLLEHGDAGPCLGLCATDGEPEIAGTLTFLHPTRAGVDDAHGRLRDAADGKPRYNDRYDVYQFFATDPEGRTVEVQTFEH